MTLKILSYSFIVKVIELVHCLIETALIIIVVTKWGSCCVWSHSWVRWKTTHLSQLICTKWRPACTGSFFLLILWILIMLMEWPFKQNSLSFSLPLFTITVSVLQNILLLPAKYCLSLFHSSKRLMAVRDCILCFLQTSLSEAAFSFTSYNSFSFLM